MQRRTILHVGFCHSGTTSLRKNLLERRDELFYCGQPYGVRGGIFSDIKYKPDYPLYSRSWAISPNAVRWTWGGTGRWRYRRRIEELCRSYIFEQASRHQSVTVSDETFVDQPEIYYTPSMMPVHTIAERLRSFFPDADILFTTRNQLNYVVSSYLNLKRNYALLAQRPIEPFDRWFEGNHTQVANLFLRNLDYSQAIRTYIDVFGRDSVFVLPLELLLHDGVREYLERLGSFLKINIGDDDITHYRAVWNRRMTMREDVFVEAACEEPRFRELYDEFMANANGAEEMHSAPARVSLSASQIANIRERVATGNEFIAQEFRLPLRTFGYPMTACRQHARTLTLAKAFHW
jgi:Sulfotransferase family